jgi:hypothetical protein
LEGNTSPFGYTEAMLSELKSSETFAEEHQSFVTATTLKILSSKYYHGVEVVGIKNL